MKSIILIAAILLISGAAFAGGDHDPCSHPVFVTHSCLDVTVTDGADGADGVDGIDGKDGADGKDGIDGLNGLNGRDGIDGRDAIIPNEWYEQLQSNQRLSLALDAAQVYLPQEKSSRFTLGAAQGNSQLGVGLGYAYVDDSENRMAFTIALGYSHDEVAGKASVGFEF